LNIPGVEPKADIGPHQGSRFKNAAAGRKITNRNQHTVYIETTDALAKLLEWYAGESKSGSVDSSLPTSKDKAQNLDKHSDDLSSTTSPQQVTANPFTPEEMAGTSSQAENIENTLKGFDGEDRDVLAKRRVNQGKFRASLLRYWNGRCCICEVANERLLVASHIVPWSKATKQEKGDPANGLLLSVLWDALFDRGIISFNDDGTAILDKLDSSQLAQLGIDKTKADISTEKLIPRHHEYLKRHRELYGFE
jgi:predicted restriction endonuclease